jgi:hypothetical protein
MGQCCCFLAASLSLGTLQLWPFSAGCAAGLGVAMPALLLYFSDQYLPLLLISAFVYRWPGGWRSLNCALCYHVSHCVGCMDAFWQLALVLLLDVLWYCYGGDSTLCNSELEEFEYCSVAVSVFLIWIIVFSDHICISLFVMYVSEIRLMGVSLVLWVE